MSRIDEIKERTKNEEYIKRDIDYYDAQDDVQYLLSRLEIAEKALDRVCEIYNSYEAEEALKKIRE